MAAVTVLVCCWFASLGLVPALLAVLAGKHILVALLLAGRMEAPADGSS